MKLSKRQLKRIIREEYTRLRRRGLLREYGPPGIGGGGNYGRGSDIERSAPSDPKGYGWMEFIGYAEEGDYDSAGEWIQGLASDYGITLDRDVEDSFIEMASADTTAKECQDAWNEYLQMIGL